MKVDSSIVYTSSPNDMMSTFTFSFFNLRANFKSSFSSKFIGEPMNTTMRVRWFFPWRCFRASYKEGNCKNAQVNFKNAYMSNFYPSQKIDVSFRLNLVKF